MKKYRGEKTIKRLFLFPFLISIKAYQFLISPIFGPTCRFYPTCSDYTYSAIKRHGLFKGVYLGLKRILRCHPFHPGGIDPVP